MVYEKFLLTNTFTGRIMQTVGVAQCRLKVVHLCGKGCMMNIHELVGQDVVLHVLDDVNPMIVWREIEGILFYDQLCDEFFVQDFIFKPSDVQLVGEYGNIYIKPVVHARGGRNRKQRVFMYARKRGVNYKIVRDLLRMYGLPPTNSERPAKRVSEHSILGWRSYRDKDDYRDISEHAVRVIQEKIRQLANCLR